MVVFINLVVCEDIEMSSVGGVGVWRWRDMINGYICVCLGNKYIYIYRIM